MPLFINNTKLSPAQKMHINNTDLTHIYFNGVLVWKYDTDPHGVADLSTCVTLTGYDGKSSAYDYYGGDDCWWMWSRYETINYSLVKFGACYKGGGTGATIDVTAYYTGVINKLALPDGAEIKRLRVYRRGLGVIDFDMTYRNTVEVSDKDSGSIHANAYASETAWASAGISAIEYFYV